MEIFLKHQSLLKRCAASAKSGKRARMYFQLSLRYLLQDVLCQRLGRGLPPSGRDLDPLLDRDPPPGRPRVARQRPHPNGLALQPHHLRLIGGEFRAAPIFAVGCAEFSPIELPVPNHFLGYFIESKVAKNQWGGLSRDKNEKNAAITSRFLLMTFHKYQRVNIERKCRTACCGPTSQTKSNPSSVTTKRSVKCHLHFSTNLESANQKMILHLRACKARFYFSISLWQFDQW